MSALSRNLFIVLGEGPSGRKGDGDPEDEKAGRTGWVMGSLYIGEEKSCLGNAATVTPRSRGCRGVWRGPGLPHSPQLASLNSRRPTSSTTDPAVPGPRGSSNNWRISSPFSGFNTRLSNVRFENEKCVEESGSQSSEGRGESELLLTDGRPSSEILRLLGLSRLGAGSCWKKCTEKKKVPQRCFRYGPGAGFHLNMPCQRVSDSCPPKIPPPQNCHIPLLAQHPAAAGRDPSSPK